MSDRWSWEYDPDHAHVTGGIPDAVVKEVERLADQLVELAEVGVDVSDLGEGPHPGGLRTMNAADGWFYFLVSPHDHLIIVVRIIPPFADL
ncbi:hypothetical protein ACFQ07_12035 [Actinomadura adrarensis]|uniref:Type II toxin-antitoxin system RelE/ParE family toxin n=1 Tax=Actinomadura adrarensis TaxID=1819600 RepID=A0ABW3CES4_9ACTN